MFKLFKFSCSAFIISLIISGCSGGKKQRFPSPDGYDLNEPKVFHLKSELDEISGVIYYPKDTSLFAINDEVGFLYKIHLEPKLRVERWRFSNAGDYEDISLVDSAFYVLKSKGTIYSFKVITADSVVIDDCKSPYAGKNEFETLYYDEFYQKLVLLCKDCKEDGKQVVTAWSFDPKTKEYSTTPFYRLNADSILSKLENVEQFKPSAAAIHPITKELYIISAVSNALVVADRKGGIKQVVPLDPGLFKQPEGMTFSTAGDLIISNEAADVGSGNIVIFKYLISQKK